MMLGSCALLFWQLTKDFTPIVLNFEARPNYPELKVTFEGCIFENLSYGPSRAYQLGDPGPHSNPGYTSIIFAINPAQTVIFRDCTFRNNKVVNTGVRYDTIELNRLCQESPCLPHPFSVPPYYLRIQAMSSLLWVPKF